MIELDNIDFTRMAKLMAAIRPDCWNFTEALSLLEKWAKELDSGDFEEGASISTAGFVLTYAPSSGCFELSLNLVDVYDDGSDFDWMTSYQPIDWNL